MAIPTIVSNHYIIAYEHALHGHDLIIMIPLHIEKNSQCFPPKG